MDVIALEGVSKYYSSTDTLALDAVSFSAAHGEIHALLGSNGAGKSTLVGIACGLLRPDGGRMLVKGRPVRFSSYRDAARAGIGLVPQQPTLAEGLTVAQNIALGHEPRKAMIFFDNKRAIYDAAMLSSGNGFSVPLDVPVQAMGRAERREAEILRAFSSGGDILFLDEPGNALSDDELAGLFVLLERLRDSGVCIIYVSHRLREICRIADRVSVLEHGRRKTVLGRGEFDETILADILASVPEPKPAPAPMPVPGESLARLPGKPVAGSRAVLEFAGVCTRPRHGEGLSGIDFTVNSGEILGIYAFGGNGLGELEDVVTGLRAQDEGKLLLDGLELSEIPAKRLYGELLGYIAGDRDEKSLCLDASVRDNAISRIVVASRRPTQDLETARIVVASRRPTQDLETARIVVASRRPTQDLETARIVGRLSFSGNQASRASSLSGGNRQRLVCARELASGCRLVVASDPLQGLDPESARGITEELRDSAAAGAAILYLSSGLDEIVGVADRIAVLHRGRLLFADPERVEAEGGSYVMGLAMGSLT